MKLLSLHDEDFAAWKRIFLTVELLDCKSLYTYFTCCASVKICRLMRHDAA